MTLGFMAFYSMMAGVWGVPINPLNYVAVLAAMALFFGSFVCLLNVSIGRIICGVSIVALGTFYVPAVVSIVPAHNEISSPIIYLIFLAYFGVVAFALFYPARKKFSLSIFLSVLALGGIFAGVTYAHRLANGEYDRPSFAFFVWQSGSSNLQIEDDSDGWLSDETKLLLEKSGIRGKLKWSGSRDYKTQNSCVVILAQKQIATPKQIFYPRHSLIIYAFDGTNWISWPTNVPTYSTFATLKPDGSQTMLEQNVVGGIDGTSAFQWK